MRCPKCDYITFDQLESCPSCNKNISKFSRELVGVTFKARIPDFLQFGAQEAEPEEEVEEVSAEMEMFDEDDDVELIGEEVDTETEGEEDLDFAEEEEPEDSEGIDFDLPDSSETAEQDNVDLELSADDDDGLDLSLDDDGLDLSVDDGDNDKGLEHSAGTEELEGLDLSLDDTDSEIVMEIEEQPEKESSLELGGLDLSDLSPSSAGDSGSAPEELTLEKTDEVSGESSQQGDGLPDLELDGLDFDAPAKPPAGSATGERCIASAKTGTALDDFGIDLGDLL